MGGLNSKAPFDDLRILGDLRTTLHRIERSRSVSVQSSWKANKEVAIALRCDAKYLLNWVKHLPKDTETLTIADKAQLVKRACQYCTWARAAGIPSACLKFDYSLFCDLELMKAGIKTHLAIVKLKITTSLAMLSEKLVGLSFLFSESRAHLEKRLEYIKNLEKRLDISLLKDETDEKSIDYISSGI